MAICVLTTTTTTRPIHGEIITFRPNHELIIHLLYTQASIIADQDQPPPAPQTPAKITITEYVDPVPFRVVKGVPLDLDPACTAHTPASPT